MTSAEKIKAYRMAAKLSIEQLAARAGYKSPLKLAALESGEECPKVLDFYRIARALRAAGIKVGSFDLFGDTWTQCEPERHPNRPSVPAASHAKPSANAHPSEIHNM